MTLFHRPDAYYSSTTTKASQWLEIAQICPTCSETRISIPNLQGRISFRQIRITRQLNLPIDVLLASTCPIFRNESRLLNLGELFRCCCCCCIEWLRRRVVKVSQ